MNILISPNEKILKAIYNYNRLDYIFKDAVDFCVFKEKVNKISLHYDGCRLKQSIFNYVVDGGSFKLVYNTLYNTLINCSDCYADALETPNMADFDIREELYSLGILVPLSIDESASYTNLSSAYNIYDNNKLNLVVTTTMHCNARCPYCYERGAEYRGFDNSKIDEMLSFIKNNVEEHGVHITWFGGEPLLNTKLIDKVTAFLLENNIEFNSFIITNGSLLNNDIINSKLEYWKVNGMQITIDGTESEYIKIKNYVVKDNAVFFKLLYNVKLIAEKDLNIDIRLNIDQNNKDDIMELAKQLDNLYGGMDNVTIYPAFIAGTNNIIPENMRVEVVKNLLQCFNNPQKMGFANKMHSSPRIIPCNIANSRAFGIDVYGKLHTCEHYVGRPEYAIGDVGVGIYGDDSRKKPYMPRKECMKCKFLPKCYGGCEAHYIEGDIPCMIEKYMIPAYLEYLAEFLQ